MRCSCRNKCAHPHKKWAHLTSPDSLICTRRRDIKTAKVSPFLNSMSLGSQNCSISPKPWHLLWTAGWSIKWQFNAFGGWESVFWPVKTPDVRFLQRIILVPLYVERTVFVCFTAASFLGDIYVSGEFSRSSSDKRGNCYSLPHTGDHWIFFLVLVPVK